MSTYKAAVMFGCFFVLLLALATSLSVAMPVHQDAEPTKSPPFDTNEAAVIENATETLTRAAGAQISMQPVAAIMTQDFEGAWPAAGWELSDMSTVDGGEYLWGKRNCHPHNGSYAGWSVGGGARGSALSCSGYYANYTRSWAVYGPFDLRGATAASLIFYMWGRTESDYDFMFVGSSTNGNDFNGTRYWGDWRNGTDGNGFHRRTLDLSSRLGQGQVWIAFVLSSDYSITYEGMTIDDVSLDVTGGQGQTADPSGYLGEASCTSINGWAGDRDDPNRAIDVHIYANGPYGVGQYLAALPADGQREQAVCEALGGANCGVCPADQPQCKHGFNFTAIPDRLKDGETHDIYVYGINLPDTGGNTVLLGGVTKAIRCVSLPFQVYLPLMLRQFSAPTPTTTPSPSPTRTPSPTPTPTPTRTPTSTSTPTSIGGAAVFGTKVRIDTSSDNLQSTDPSLAVDGQGRVHIVWTGSRPRSDTPEGVGLEVYYSRELLDGGFSAPISITVPTGFHSRHPAAAVDSQGVVHIAFRRGDSQSSVTWEDDIYYVNNRGGTFRNPVIIADGKMGLGAIASPMTPAIGIGPNDVVHVAFLMSPPGGGSIMYMNNRSGQFGAAMKVSGNIRYPDSFVMRLDSRGWPHFAIMGDLTLGADSQVYYVQPTSNPLIVPAFEAPLNVSNWPRDVVDFWPGFTLDAAGHAHIFWRDAFSTPYVNDEGGLWYTNNVAGDFDEPVQVGWQFAPHAATDPDNKIHLVYRYVDDLAYKNNRSGSFNRPAVIAAMALRTPGGFSALMYGHQPFLVGPDGDLHLVYFNPIVDFHIYYVKGSYAAGSPLATPTPTATAGPSPTPSSGWRLQVVDEEGSRGRYSSLALDAEGRAHIAYTDNDRQAVMYARQEGSGWQIETVDAGAPTGNTTLHLDSRGQPHVVFIGRSGSDAVLKYATLDASGWHAAVILVPAGSYTQARYSSFALDAADRPHITYEERASDQHQLKYVYRDGTGWHSETVVTASSGGILSSLQIGADGAPRVAYCGGGDPFLGYAYRDGSGWHAEQLAVDSWGEGSNCSLAVNTDGQPHLSFRGPGHAALIYAYKGSSGWVRETAHYSIPGDVGYSTSLLLDSTGQPRIAFYEAGLHDLIYAYRQANTWHVETVQRSWQDVGFSPSLALDRQGRPHISYFAHGRDDLMYAHYETVAR